MDKIDHIQQRECWIFKWCVNQFKVKVSTFLILLKEANLKSHSLHTDTHIDILKR